MLRHGHVSSYLHTPNPKIDRFIEPFGGRETKNSKEGNVYNSFMSVKHKQCAGAMFWSLSFIATHA